MDFTAKWSLFGETVQEEISLEKSGLSEYITGDLKTDIKRICSREKEKQKEDSTEYSVSELVQDAFFLTALSEISVPEKYEQNKEIDEIYFHADQSESLSALYRIDDINRSLMTIFTTVCYEVKYRMDIVDNAPDVIENQDALIAYFEAVGNNIINRNPDFRIDTPEVEDEALRELVSIFNGDLSENSEYRYWNIRGKIFDWITSESDFPGTKMELKRRLLRDLFVEFDSLGIRRRRRNFFLSFYSYEYDVIDFACRFVQDDGYRSLVNEYMNEINSDILYIQNRICDIAFVKRNSIVKDKILKKLEIQLKKYPALDKYITGAQCFALMKSYKSNVSYFSISGVWHTGEIEKACQQIESIMNRKGCYRVELSNVGIADKVFYHISNNQDVFLSYSHYKSYHDSGKGTISSKDNRLFSCCERKLFAKIDNQDAYAVYVRYSSCYMCIDAARYLRSNSTYKFRVIVGKHNTSAVKLDPKQHDQYAEKVLDEIKKFKI